jgi:hypothetical protein
LINARVKFLNNRYFQGFIRSMSGGSSLTGGVQHSIPAPKATGAATGGQQLSATANQFVDKIDPFSKRGNSRRRRRPVNSSRYHSENEPDLVQLPLIKGSKSSSFI